MAASAAASSTALRPPWLHVARAAWILAALVGLIWTAYFIPHQINSPLPSCAAPEAECPAWTYTREDAAQAREMGLPEAPLTVALALAALLGRLSMPTVGAIIVWRRSDDWIAMLFATFLMSVLVEGEFTSGVAALDAASRVVFLAGTLAFLPAPFLFPNGRIAPRWLRWPALSLCAALGYLTVAAPINSPIAAGLWLVYLAAACYSVTYRYYRVSNAVERQQTKWVVVAMLCLFANIVFLVIGAFYPAAQPSTGRIAFLLANTAFYAASYVSMAVCLLFAILRYRVWDIDILINRALVYGALTGALALVYFGSVVILQGILGALAAGAAQTPLAVVASTLAIAALFAPLRRRIQEVIDRRFYRRKYDAARTLAAFGRVARDETDLDRLAGELVGVVNETVQPAHASLWLRPPATSGPPTEGNT